MKYLKMRYIKFIILGIVFFGLGFFCNMLFCNKISTLWEEVKTITYIGDNTLIIKIYSHFPPDELQLYTNSRCVNYASGLRIAAKEVYDKGGNLFLFEEKNYEIIKFDEPELKGISAKSEFLVRFNSDKNKERDEYLRQERNKNNLKYYYAKYLLGKESLFDKL